LTKNTEQFLTALVADKNGEIFELDGYAAVGRSGSTLTPLTRGRTVPMPYGSELMYLPDRCPTLYNKETNEFQTLDENPFRSGDPIFPVAAFNSPGYVQSRMSAYKEKKGAKYLPLFSYGAVGWYGEGFRTPLILVDKERRQDLRLMKREKVLSGIRVMKKKLPRNRLRQHLESCALTYGCPAGKNFFLGRYEAPLPTSTRCNARCLGCLSLQDKGVIPVSQNRIKFTPRPEEIAEVALSHINRTKRAVVSFGQGCEGDPLLAAGVIEPAIKRIRTQTDAGTIHMNTNGSKPTVIERLLQSGLDSIRISINSVQEGCYKAYFRPVDYSISDVFKSIDIAIRLGKRVSLNYLNMPGFTDTPEERNALIAFLKKYPIHMIQWRNLNFDPLRYWKLMDSVSNIETPMGMKTLLNEIRSEFPALRFGYFNPPKESFQSPSTLNKLS